MNPLRSLVLYGFLTALVGCGGGSAVVDPDVPDPDVPEGYQYPVGKVFFSHPPVGLDGSVFMFEGMGGLGNPYPSDHGGFHHLEIETPVPTIPVIAPANGQITLIWTHEGYNGVTEHALGLKVSTTIDLLWGHMGRLSDRLELEAPPLGVSRNVEIPVLAGDTLGYVANTALDLTVNDSSIQNKILHPEFYGPNALAAPLEDYYQEPLKSQLLALTVREIAPRTGSMGFDVAGTLSGLWYLEGSDPRIFRYDHAFQFGYHHIQAHRATIVDGLVFAQQHQQQGMGEFVNYSFWIKGNPRMESITPGSGPVKFEMYAAQHGVNWTPPNPTLADISGLDDEAETTTILLVEMLDGETVRLERFDAPGISPEDVAGFTENARTYVRNPLG